MEETLCLALCKTGILFRVYSFTVWEKEAYSSFFRRMNKYKLLTHVEEAVSFLLVWVLLERYESLNKYENNMSISGLKEISSSNFEIVVHIFFSLSFFLLDVCVINHQVGKRTWKTKQREREREKKTSCVIVLQTFVFFFFLFLFSASSIAE